MSIPLRASSRATPQTGSRRGPAAKAAGTAPHPLLRLQRQVGNRAVQRLLAQREADEKAPPAGVYATLDLAQQGELRGESKEPGYEGKIPLSALTFGAPKNQGNRAQPEATHDLVLVKAVDSVSPRLMVAASKGERVNSAKFEYVRREPDAKPVTALELNYEDGYFASYSTSGEDSEEMTLNARPK